MAATSKVKHHSVSRGDVVLKAVVGAAAVSVVAILIGLGVDLAYGSRLSITTFGLSFVTGSTWNPFHDIYNVGPFILGTLITSAIALVIGLPIGLGVAIYLSERRGNRGVGLVLGSLVELLAAVPSVIFGLWGLIVLVPFMSNYVEPALKTYFGFTQLFNAPAFGHDLLTAGVILAIMIIPTISAVTRDVLNAVPNSQREAMFSLGATDWEVVRKSVLPYARSGIFGATILGLGRAVGETMAVTMVVGNATAIPNSLLSPGFTLTSLIVNQFGTTTDPLADAALVEVGLVLFMIALIINFLARVLVWRMTRSTKFRV